MPDVGAALGELLAALECIAREFRAGDGTTTASVAQATPLIMRCCLRRKDVTSAMARFT